ncbi:MAG: potassium channel protein [Chlorobi bacterium]|nr:potassium channel protein [Chlorobiota bacterium]
MRRSGRFLFWFVVALFVVSISTLGYVAIEGVHWFDALYMTIITITTVGYGEVFPLSTGGKVWTMLVIVMGWGVIAIAVTEIFSVVLSEELWRRRRFLPKFRKMKDHYIIAGYGRIARYVAQFLKSNKRKVVIIVPDRENADKARQDGMNVIEGSPTEDKTLRNAGIEKAKALITLLENDADNIFTVMSARTLNPDLYIVSPATDRRSRELLYKAGANRIIQAYELMGQMIANAILKPYVLDLFSVSNFLIEEVLVNEDSPINGKTIKEIYAEYGGDIHILGIKKQGEAVQFIPPLSTKIEAGMILLVAGKPEVLEKLKM